MHLHIEKSGVSNKPINGLLHIFATTWLTWSQMSMKKEYTDCSGINVHYVKSHSCTCMLWFTYRKPLVQEAPNPKTKMFLSRLAVVFALSIEARYYVENEYVVGAAPTYLSDQQVYCLLRCDLYQKFDGSYENCMTNCVVWFILRIYTTMFILLRIYISI